MNVKLSLLLIIACVTTKSRISLAQFPGGVGTLGTTAIHKDSSIFIAWATQCTVTRGYVDIANPSMGNVSFGNDTLALGKADNKVVSLGDRGSAIVSFNLPIKDGPGFDFAVFENAFNDTFLELAVIEVSSDGVNYFRFPAYSNTQTHTQIGPFDNAGDPTKIHNLAGKYRALYGTPFDLSEIADHSLLDKNNIKYIKIIDVVGSINPAYATYDVQNNPINDPYPTAFNTGGFDLDAVGAIHINTESSLLHNLITENKIRVYPNPCINEIFISSELTLKQLCVIDVQGKVCYKATLTADSIPFHADLSFLPEGMYILILQDEAKEQIHKAKLLKQN
ncbi:MAG: T9SS type A sorting domain-containing protein [Bacteroidia bacterium]|nr:T9SS type A sorting domain-containing protein [Bacteroidia bacterium]